MNGRMAKRIRRGALNKKYYTGLARYEDVVKLLKLIFKRRFGMINRKKLLD